jgi:ribosomal protein S18 acetylase RimI-like enzyme
MVKVRRIEYGELLEVSNLAMNFFSEPKVSDNSIIVCEENRNYWLELVYKLLAENREALIVAEENNKIVGYLLYKLDASYPFKVKEKWAYISDLYVLPEYRRRGIGNALINQMEEIVKKSGIYKVRLLVWGENTNALEFYKKLGFKIKGFLLEKELK